MEQEVIETVHEGKPIKSLADLKALASGLFSGAIAPLMGKKKKKEETEIKSIDDLRKLSEEE